MAKIRGNKMTFIGVVSDNKSFQNIESNIKGKKINLIHINKKSIANIKNIKLEIVIINSDLNEFEHELKTLKCICSNAKYIVINTDINLKFDLLNKNKNIIVTYGLNHKATVTISSITENNVLIYLQRSIKNIEGTTIEVGEKLVKTSENSKLKIYEILIIYIIFLINANKII